MSELKAGTRMRSDVCNTEVMVIAAADSSLQICCGGAAMIDAKQEPSGGTIDADNAQGTLLGKRYTNDAGTVELLCVKPGEGSLSASGEALELKEAKALPSSD